MTTYWVNVVQQGERVDADDPTAAARRWAERELRQKGSAFVGELLELKDEIGQRWRMRVEPGRDGKVRVARVFR